MGNFKLIRLSEKHNNWLSSIIETYLDNTISEKDEVGKEVFNKEMDNVIMFSLYAKLNNQKEIRTKAIKAKNE